MISSTPEGLFCAAGGFHIDPWEPVELALLTHLHGDHARLGSRRYLCAAPGLSIAQRRLPGAQLEAVPYGERRALGEVTVSFHPAGHVLGSAQLRLERGGEVWVVSGDYKRAPDPTCAPFEPLRCDTFITEATFGLPIYRWDAPELLAREIYQWWEETRARGKACVLFCYVLGKAQRLLAELTRFTDRAVYVHGMIEPVTDLYRAAGVKMLPTLPVAETAKGKQFAGELVLAPPSARGTPWAKRFGDYSPAYASGWMRVRGTRRRQGFDRGFALSDHADWPALLQTIEETGARRVLVTHGYTEPLARWLREQGLDAAALKTRFEGEVAE
jgi:putative mRNA 3-end processing factor